jgi:hypothetical protein
MFTKLRLSLTKQLEDIESSIFALVVMYSCIGYLTAGIIALPIKTYRETGTLTWYQVVAVFIAACFLLFVYYTRYRMIVDVKNDGD